LAANVAGEADLCHDTVALVPDYDCWSETEEAVTVDAILKTLRKKVALAKRLLRAAVKSAASGMDCGCQQALQHAIVTAPGHIPGALRKKVALLTERVLPLTKGKR